MSRRTATAAAMAALLLALFQAGGPVSASAPTNDDAASPTVISALPFSDTLDVTDATSGSGDEYAWCFYGLQQTVYYGYSFASRGEIRVRTEGSDYGTAIVAFEVMSFGSASSLAVIGCGESTLDIKTPDLFSNVLIMVGRQPWSAPGTQLVLNVDEVPAPANDDFDAAVPISAFPYSATVDPYLATWAEDDPTLSCGGAAGPTVWYAMTPGDEKVLLQASVSDYEDLQAGVFTGERGSLTEIACGNSSVAAADVGIRAHAGGIYMEFTGEPGVTYYLMLKETEPRILPISLSVNTALVATAKVTSTRVRPNTGLVTIQGVLECNKTGEAFLGVQLEQKIGRFTITGSGSLMSTPCTPDGASWSIQVTPTGGPFVGGKATLTLGGYAFASGQGLDFSMDQEVRLTGKP